MTRRSAPTHDLAALYREYQGLVRWVVRARGVPQAHVEDVVHDVFLTIHRRWSERDGSLPLRMWVISVARNVAFSERRSAARRARRDSCFTPEPESSLLEPQLDARRALRVLQQFLDDLTPPQAEVFVLCEVQGITAPEVAAALDASVNTVYSRLRLARQRFSQRFGAIEPRESATLLQELDRVSQPAAQERERRLASLVACAGGASAAPSLWAFGAAGAVAFSFGLGLAVPRLPEVSVAATAAPTHRVAKPPVLAGLLPATGQIVAPGASPATRAPRDTTTAGASSSSESRRVSRAPGDVGKEAMLLARAKEALRADQIDEAQAGLESHTRMFPRGALALERARLTVDAWCAAGRPEAARRAALGLGGQGLPARRPEDPCEFVSRRDGTAVAVVPPRP